MAEGKWVSYLRVSTGRQGRSGSGLEAHRAAVAHRRAKGVPSPRAVGMPRSLSPAATSLRGAGGDRAGRSRSHTQCMIFIPGGMFRMGSDKHYKQQFAPPRFACVSKTRSPS
jgi:hypothetical protein